MWKPFVFCCYAFLIFAFSVLLFSFFLTFFFCLFLILLLLFSLGSPGLWSSPGSPAGSCGLAAFKGFKAG